MKKIILGILIAIVVVGIAAVVGVALFLDSGLKKGVETIGPQVTGVDVKLDSVRLSLWSGSGSIKGLVIGNPEGYKSPHAIRVSSASLSVAPGSLFSDKIIVKSIRVEAPEIIYELGPGGNNLKKIQANIEAAAGSSEKSAPAEPASPGKKLQVDEVIITGGKVTLAASMLGGKGVTSPLPEINLKNLGTGPEGITGAELTKQILSQVMAGSFNVAQDLVKQAGKEVLNAAEGAGKEALKAAEGAGKTAADSAGKALKGVGDLFKKKKE